MEAVFRLVLTTSLYASIVGLIIIILKTILKDKLNPKWHYVIWVVLILKLLVPFGPESALSLFNTVPKMPQQTSFTQTYEEYHVSITAIRQEKPNIPTTWAIKDSSLYLAAAAEKAAPYIWVAGAMLMLGWLVFTSLSLHRKISKTATSVPESINLIFDDCKRKMDAQNIDIIMQDAINTPSLFGLVRPKILLAPAILKLDDREISYILMHELAHYKRKDLIANHLLLLLQLIHWFNPIIWLCFKKIRQDMEVAADEKVLNLLESREQKEYGKALLSVLESFKSARLAPKLIGMVDDKKNIERRIRMIRMMNFFRYKRRFILVIGVLCVVVLSGVLLTSGRENAGAANDPYKASEQSSEYSVNALFRFKTPYVGNNSKVVNLINNLPYAEFRGVVSLKTKELPYGVTVNYDMSNENIDMEQIQNTLRNNAIALFALINNADIINFNVKTGDGEQKFEYTRKQLQQGFDKDLREYSKSEKELEALLNSLSLRLAAYPEKYAMTMSSTPGIRILAQYNGKADKVRYSTESGGFLTWNGGKINRLSQSAELPLETPVYWSPIAEEKALETNSISVKAEVLSNNVKVAEKRMNIKFDNANYLYTVEASPDVLIAKVIQSQPRKPTSIDEAVSQAIKGPGGKDGPQELSTEGHIIIDTEEKDGKIKAYTIASFGAFGFENGIFTVIGGTGAISTVMTFSKNEKGEYSLLEYKQPMDGSDNLESKKEMFPRRLWNKVLSEQKYYPELAKQQEEQARQYLKSIGRNAKVSAAHVEKKLFDLNVEASNKLLEETSKNHDLNEFPGYWIGTREIFEDGTRYIYETSQGKTGDGYDLITFRKTKEDGIVVKEYQYKIMENEVQLIKKF